MKNLLFVSVALSVFTVTSFSASAQFKKNFLKDMNLFNDGVEYVERRCTNVAVNDAKCY